MSLAYSETLYIVAKVTTWQCIPFFSNTMNALNALEQPGMHEVEQILVAFKSTSVTNQILGKKTSHSSSFGSDINVLFMYFVDLLRGISYNFSIRHYDFSLIFLLHDVTVNSFT